MYKNLQSKIDQLKSQQELMCGSGEGSANKNLLEFYTKIMIKALDAERCNIFIHDPVKETLWMQYGTAMDETRIDAPKPGSTVGDVIATGKHQVKCECHPGEAKECQDEVTAESGFETYNEICVPIKSLNKSKVTGAIEVLNKKDGVDFTDEDRKLVEEMAYFLEMALENICLDQEALTLTEKLFEILKKTVLWSLAAIAVLLGALFIYLSGLAFIG